MNGWVKKNVAVIIQILVLIIGLVAVSATVRADIGYIKEAQAGCDLKNSEQDACINTIEHSLGRIEGKLDMIVEEVYSE